MGKREPRLPPGMDQAIKAVQLILHPELADASRTRLAQALLEEARRMSFGGFGALAALARLAQAVSQAALDEALGS
jgi:hypothetical protein